MLGYNCSYKLFNYYFNGFTFVLQYTYRNWFEFSHFRWEIRFFFISCYVHSWGFQFLDSMHVRNFRSVNFYCRYSELRRQSSCLCHQSTVNASQWKIITLGEIFINSDINKFSNRKHYIQQDREQLVYIVYSMVKIWKNSRAIETERKLLKALLSFEQSENKVKKSQCVSFVVSINAKIYIKLFMEFCHANKAFWDTCIWNARKLSGMVCRMAVYTCCRYMILH